MKKELRILILKDNPDDVELVVRELEKEEFFDVLSALKIKQEIFPIIPLIIISGAIGEEFATECIKAGATDYVFKR